MNILGISHPISFNSAACLLKNGKLIAFAEEERFIKIKHSPYMPANKAIDFCLKEGNITLDDIDYIAIGYDSFLNIFKSNIFEQSKMVLRRSSSLPKLFPINSSLEAKNLFYMFFATLSYYYQGLFRLPFNYQHKKVRFIRHHLAHIASSYYVSGFDHACIISADGGGGQEAGMLAIGEHDKISVIRRISATNSLGYLYSLVTKLIGFESHDGEGKVMGLAAYGKDSAKTFPFVSYKNGTADINQQKMYLYLSKIKDKLQKNPMNKTSIRLAACLQKTIEEAYVHMAEFLYKQTKIKNFCLAGGVSLNCLANAKVLTSGFVDNIFIQPASSDAGTALGAALQVYVDIYKKRPSFTFEHVYYGPDFSNQEIERVIKKCEIQYFKRESDIERATAKLLKKGNIIGWFQGKMEVGPRALGNRSILADPSNKKMKNYINDKVKEREPWRPFAPSILMEFADRYLEDIEKSPFMILESRVKKTHADELIAATHIDGTIRPHTVSKKTNPRYWKLIYEFYKLTDIPALLNTSFNLSGEPMVCTPSDAISTFYRSGLDYLVLGDFLISKNPISHPL